MVWLTFAALALVILVAGRNLSRYGDVLSEKLGFERSWIGVVLIATVTSLPELVTGVSAVTVYRLPDIAVGDVVGPCMLNLVMLAMLDFLHKGKPAKTTAHQGHIVTAALGIVLLGIVSLALAMGSDAPSIGWVGFPTLTLLLAYPVIMKLLFSHERRRVAEFVKSEEDAPQYPGITTGRAWMLYGINAAVIFAAASALPGVGDQIAQATGLSGTFVGTLFIAICTTLPEITVSISAVRMGAVDMAFGNLLGSNLFNMAILGIDDLFYTPGALLASVDPSHAISAAAAVAMTGLAIVGLTYRAERKRLPLAWDSVAMLGVYVIAFVALARKG